MTAVLLWHVPNIWITMEKLFMKWVPEQYGRHLANVCKCILFDENIHIMISVSLKFVPIGHKSDWVQVMANVIYH